MLKRTRRRKRRRRKRLELRGLKSSLRWAFRAGLGVGRDDLVEKG